MDQLDQFDWKVVWRLLPVQVRLVILVLIVLLTLSSICGVVLCIYRWNQRRKERIDQKDYEEEGTGTAAPPSRLSRLHMRCKIIFDTARQHVSSMLAKLNLGGSAKC